MAHGTQSLGVAALLGLIAVAAAVPKHKDSRVPLLPAKILRRPPRTARLDTASRQLNGAAALLALAALTDSAVEHYRGSFHNKTMYVPLGAATATLLASLRDTIAPGAADRSERAVVDALAVATGIIGTGFHLYNVGKRPSGFSWLNLFYSAPLGAPASLSLAGLLRRMALLVRTRAMVAGMLPGKALAWLVSLGLLGTSAEAALLHFRGAYHNPAMVIPVTAPPLAAGLLVGASADSSRSHPLTRWALRLVAGAGFLGSAFHAYGVSRNMGGWRNWSQNILNGPPLPAPPAFTALAIAGLAALSLIERRR
ncbi:MAG TPA: hypothetical protein VG328_04270 [Stellaceae bacterium]|jgi:hypothetical protein|nr:hypothetical protein [Stellaceae bacterium]